MSRYKLGEYVGPIEALKGQRGVAISCGDITKIQFDKGDWDWHCFHVDDIKIDRIQTLNAEDLIIGEKPV